MASFFFILFFSFTVSAQSVLNQENCTSTDIRETNPKIRDNATLREHFSTPRNQDSIGWCYAFSASDFLTAEIGVSVSALHTSILYNSAAYNSPERREDAENHLRSNGRFKEVYESGWPNKAINDVIAKGWVCSEADLPFDVDRPYDIKEMIDYLESKKHLANPYYKNALCHEVNLKLKDYSLAFQDVEAIVDSMMNQNLNQTLEVFAEKACKNRITDIPKIDLTWVDKNRHQPQDFLAKINQNINSGSPVQISYQPKFVSTLSGDGYHASMVIGRRWRNGRCEFNIRNSWGKLCATYKPGIECNRDEGTFWMSETDLMRASAGFYQVQR